MACDSGFSHPRIPLFAGQRTHLSLLRGSRPHQAQHSGQVVRREREQRLTRELFQPLVPRLAQTTHRLDPAEGLFDHLSPAQTHRVALATRGASIDGAAADLARHVRPDTAPFERSHEFRRVIALVRTHRRARLAHTAVDHPDRRFPLRATRGLRALDIDDEPVAVLRQRVRHVAQLRLSEFALLVQPRLRVGRALVGRVAALVAFEVSFRIAPGRLVRTTAVLGHKALVAGPGLDHRAVDAEVLVGHETLPLGKMQYATEELACDVGAEQTVAIDAEDGAVPHRVIHAQANEPSEQQVVVELLDELALAADREEDLHEQRTQQLLGRNRRAPGVRVTLIEQRTHVGENAVDQRTQSAQRVVLRHALFQAHVAEHRRLGILLAAHGKSGKAERRFEAGVCLKIRATSSERGFSPAC